MRWFLWLRCYALSCQWRWLPLNRALVSLRKNHQKFTHKVLKIQLLAFKLHNWTFKFGLMLSW
ncbi:acetyltransferase [Vibrio cholerae]|nr:acetyltransferase [Vibrio cholerae]EGR0608932.1 acetyltransferase [Vibrio cholerae]EGR5566863.1 acetyltransferase [Vibrio cholerae]EGR5575206.1 acetyltransferase [Vibrio cholerae]EGR5734135.1 acetyltransferase [Vibrio cholerae]